MIIHRHHIIPTHMGGSNHPSNIIELTIPEHAEAHHQLYLQHGKWQDFMAWKALSGQIALCDLRKEISRLANLGRIRTEETKQKIREARKRQITTQETRDKMSKTRLGRKLTWDLKNNTPEANAKRSAALIGKSKKTIQCIHCNQIGGIPAMTRWHFDNCKRKN